LGERQRDLEPHPAVPLVEVEGTKISRDSKTQRELSLLSLSLIKAREHKRCKKKSNKYYWSQCSAL